MRAQLCLHEHRRYDGSDSASHDHVHGRGDRPCKALLSLLFGAQLGGFNTLVGVPSNVLSSGLLESAGYEGFGLCLCVVGMIYFTLIDSKMLRDTGYIPEFAQTERKPLDKRKAIISCTTLFCVLVRCALDLNVLPMRIAAVIGALVIMGTKCMTV